MWEQHLLEGAPDHGIALNVRSAIRSLLRDDLTLLEVDANERSISHRLAVYLEREFAGLHVDCEYNRDEHEPKRLHLAAEEIRSDDDQGQTVFPDIIVHTRRTPHNVLAIEIKKHTGGNEEKDLDKLRALRRELGYAYALFLRFGTGPRTGEVDVIWSAD